MLVVVNQPHINSFKIEGTIDPSFLEELKKIFGSNLEIQQSEDEEYINIKDTNFYKEMSGLETLGSNMRFYRKLLKMTQTELAEKLKTSKQYVSDMERGYKAISKETAKKIAKIYNEPISFFI